MVVKDYTSNPGYYIQYRSNRVKHTLLCRWFFMLFIHHHINSLKLRRVFHVFPFTHASHMKSGFYLFPRLTLHFNGRNNPRLRGSVAWARGPIRIIYPRIRSALTFAEVRVIAHVRTSRTCDLCPLVGWGCGTELEPAPLSINNHNF